MTQLLLNQSFPIQSLSGGSYAVSNDSATSSLVNLFAKGAGNSVQIKQADPFAGQAVSRYEVSDTAKVVDLGEMVVFLGQTDGDEPFWTSEVLPLVSQGWAVRMFSYGKWVFPQMAVRPTAETGTPRLLESYSMKATTNFAHYSIGSHMSIEYMNTERGKLNQYLNLRQMAMSVQASMNLHIQIELLKCNSRTRHYLETTGRYHRSDVMEAIQRENERFCILQKTELGAEILTTQLSEQVKKNNGQANTWIMSKKLNNLVLTKEHRTMYDKGGQGAVDSLRDQNRTILNTNANTPVYYTDMHPERFGAKLTPWQKNVQIGTYSWAGEIPNLNSGEYNEKYLERYNTKCLSAFIYDQELDARVEMKAGEMLYHCNLFQNDGSLCPLPSPSQTDDPNYRKDVEKDFGFYLENDVVPAELHPYLGRINGASLEGAGVVRSNHLENARGSGRKSPNRFNNPLKYIGHMDRKHFTATDYKSAGYQILLGLAKNMGITVSQATRIYNEGMELYKEMCQTKIDPKTLSAIFEKNVKDHLLSKLGNKIRYETKPTNVDRKDVYLGDADEVRAEFAKQYGVHNGTDPDDSGGFNTQEKMFEDDYRKRIDSSNLTLQEIEDLKKKDAAITEYLDADRKGKGKHSKALAAWLPLEMARRYASKRQQKTCLVYDNASIKEEDIWKDLLEACTSEEYGNGLKEFKDPVGRKILPLSVEEGRLSLAGYASFDGLKELSRLYGSKDEKAVRDVGLDKLKIAHDFVRLIEKFSTVLYRYFPGCALFDENSVRSVHSRDKTKESVVAEKLLGMVGIPVWMNLQHAKTFVTPETRHEADVLENPGNPYFDNTDVDKVVNPMLELVLAVYGRYMGDPYNSILSKMAELEEYAKNKKDPEASKDVKELEEKLEYVLNPTSGVKKMDNYDGDIKISDVSSQKDTFFKLVGSDGDNMNANSALLAIFGSKQKYLYSALVVEMVDYLLSAYVNLKDIKSEVSKFVGIATADKTIKELLEEIRKHVNSEMVPKKTKGTPGGPNNKVAKWLKMISDALGGEAEKKVFLIADMNLKLDPSKEFKSGEVVAAIQEIAKNLKVNLPMRETDVSQSMIGGKHPHRRRGGGRPDVLHSADRSSFFRTSLVFSAEQVLELVNISTQSAEWHGVFDLRISDPSNFRHYLSTLHFPSMIEAIEKANEKFKIEDVPRYKNVRQLPRAYESGENSEDRNSVLLGRGWSIPLLRQENKGKRVFLGSKATGQSPESKQHGYNDFGINLESVTDNMRILAYSVQKQCERDLQFVAAMVYMVSPFDYATLDSLLQNNLKFPISFILFRPHMNYVTESGAFLAPGLQTLGFSSVAGLDYIAGSNVLTKEWNSNLTYWFVPVVMHPENCAIQNNLAVVSFGTGGGSVYYTPEAYNSSCPGYMEYKENHPSVMVLPLPKNEMVKSDVISVTGRIPQHSSPAMVTENDGAYPPAFSTCARGNSIWKWNLAERNGFLNTLSEDGVYASNNVICFRGSTWYYSPYGDGGSGKIAYWCPNRGHFGREEGVGCKEVRRGVLKKWPNFNYGQMYEEVS